MVFTINHLPICSDPPSIRKSGLRGNILLVDDSPDELGALSIFLETADYSVQEVLSGKMAIQVSHFTPPDLILLDVCLSDMSGYDVCRSLKASIHTRDIPIIFMSGLVDIASKVQAFEAGGIDYLTKPVHIEELLVRIDSHLTRRNLQKQLLQTNLDLEQQLLEQTNQIATALTFEAVLKRITDRVRDSLDENQILQAAVQELALHLEIHGCDTALYDLAAHTSKICHECTHASIQPAAGMVIQMDDFPRVYDQLLRGDYALFCPDRLSPSDARASNTQLAILACPLINEQGVFGDLWVFKDRDAIFSDLEIRLVQQVANQCAIALRQAHLYHSSQLQVQELEHLNRLKDDFLSTVSHELRTPISNIKLAAQMLEIILKPMGVMENESNRVARYFKILHDECQRETDLVGNLLDLTRIDAGTEPIHTTPINPALWIAHIVESFTARSQENNQQLQLTIPPDLPTLVTDLSYLERILTELLTNAYKYTPAGEHIEVSVSVITEKSSRKTRRSPQANVPKAVLPQSTLKIAITNTGIEIPVAEQERVFEKFYRIPNNDPWKHGGTGLGLALVKKLVERLKGQVFVVSEPIQTTFVLNLPINCDNCDR
jgi:signal transduction histidine kinase